MTMTSLSKIAVCLSAAAVLALSGCQAGAAAPPTAATIGAATQRPGSSGDTTTSQVSSSNGHACSILTRQELTPLLGADPGPGKDASDSTTTACVYTGAGVVSIVVDHSGSTTDSKTQFGMYCSAKQSTGSESPPQPGLENVNGIAVADGACLSIVGGAVAAMYVLKGPDILSINIQTGLDAKITSDALIALGKIAAGRL
jgi:hypothetical protein